MNRKQVLLDTLLSKPTDDVPWVPFVGAHGGTFVGANAEEYLKSADLIVDGLTQAAQRYRADGLPIVFDLQLEAEILGCQLTWAKETPPSVTRQASSRSRSRGPSARILRRTLQ